MTDRCPRCAREIADALNVDHHTDGIDRCWRPGGDVCLRSVRYMDGYRAGLQAGVALAKFLAIQTMTPIDWSDVDREQIREAGHG